MIGKKTYYLLLLLLVTFFWGLTFPMIKYSLSYVSPDLFLLFRFAVSAIFLLPLVYFRGAKLLRGKVLRYGFIAGLLLFLGYYFQTVGLFYTTPAKSGIITGLYVVLLPIVSLSYLKTKVSGIDIASSVTAFAGIVIMSLGSLGTASIQLGDILTVVCAVAYAYQVAYVSKHSSEVDSVSFTFVQIIVVTLFSAILLPLSFFGALRITVTWFVVFTVVFTAVFAGIFAFYISNRALIYVEPTAAGVIFVGEPVFAAISSVIFTGEKIGLYILTGGTLMVLAMLATTLKRYYDERESKTHGER